MMVPMPDGTEAEIDHLPVEASRETLGVWSSPDGSATGALRAMTDKAQEWVDRAKEASLRRKDVWFLLNCQFWPRVGYGLSCNLTQKEIAEAAGVVDEILQAHGVPPASKQTGVVRLMYENLNGINNRIAKNKKLEKARGLIDDLEADVVCFNEHRLNLRHKQNKNGFAQMFNGGETEVRAVAAHNVHEVEEVKDIGRTQEGGTAMLAFGQLLEYYEFEASGRDELGLARWVSMVFRGANGLTTRVVCGYNPCYNNRQESRTAYQGHRRYYLLKERDNTCPRRCFREDLIKKLEEWRSQGERLIVCMDANENICRKAIGKALTCSSGLNMSEVVGDFTGEKLGATFFRGKTPIDGVWATKDVDVVGACVMPAGFGVGDHRLFVVDFRLESLVGNAPPKIERASIRRLNTKIPHIATRYNEIVEEKFLEHRLNSRMVQADLEATDKAEIKAKIDAIDNESRQYMRHGEKKCRKIRSGKIPFSPEASIWIKRRTAYESLIRLKDGKIRNRSNCKRSALRSGISTPLKLSRRELKERLKICAVFEKSSA